MERAFTADAHVESVAVTAHARPSVVTTTSLHRARGPRPGVHLPAFAWDDLLAAPPPGRHARGSGAYTVYAGTERGRSLRIQYATIVSYSAHNGEISVDERLSVQRRVAFELLDRERAFFDRASGRARARFARSLAAQGRIVRRARPRWARRGATRLLRLEARAGYAAIRGFRRVSGALVQLPDSLYERYLRVEGHVYDRLGRRSLWDGIRDPKSLSAEQKGVVLFLSTILLVAAIFVLNTVFSIVLPSFAPAYSAVFNAFMLGAATAVLLPFPPSELLMIPPYLAAGAVVAFATLVLSKVVGAWFVFFVGDALNTVIEKQTAGKPRTARLVAWMHKHSERYGGPVLTAFLTIPFLPDTLALYVFAISGIRFRAYMMAVLVGSAIRYGAVAAVLVLYGEARLEAWFG